MVWKSIQDYFSTPDKRTSRKILFNKMQDALTTSSAPALAALVASYGRPGVMVPAMRAEEEIDTNLLTTVFPSEVNIGPTELTYSEIRLAMLKIEESGSDRLDAVREDESLPSVTIESALFRDIVEPGTAGAYITYAYVGQFRWRSLSSRVCRFAAALFVAKDARAPFLSPSKTHSRVSSRTIDRAQDHIPVI